MSNHPVDDIADLLQRQGARQYGNEAVSQLGHTLQCAHLAEAAGESTDASYLGQLSPASLRSLALQGGIFSAQEAIAFMNHATPPPHCAFAATTIVPRHPAHRPRHWLTTSP